MDSFQEAYAKLNTEQKKAVTTIEGPVMVVAGPGTGKTQILTLRIANIVDKTDTQPENILALTFTEAAAHNMRRRLVALMGNAAYRVVINTFHGFCNDVIKRYPEDFPGIVGSKSITDIDQVAFIESILATEKIVLLKPFGDPSLYVRDIVSSIGELKREGVTAEKFKTLVMQEKEAFDSIPDLYHERGAHSGKMKGDYQKLERKILKNEELALVYVRYQELLRENKAYDFSDMILEVLRALEHNGNLLQLLQEEYHYVLVDEHQDTNNAQNKILELLMNYHPNPNLFVVGDEKQAIFRFQGASLENFQYVTRLYPSVTVINLIENYRSTQSVLDTADKLFASGLHKNALHAEQKIRVGEFATEESERYFVAHDIRKRIDTGVKPEDIAILYRNNKDAFAIARDLARLGVLYTIESDQDLFSQSDVQKLLLIMKAISEYGTDIYITPLLHLSLFAIDPLDAYKILRNAADRRKYSLYDLIGNEELLGEINLTDTKKILSLGTNLKNWVKESREKDLLTFFEYIVRDTGLLEDMLGSSIALERFDAINAVFDQVRSLVERNPSATLQDFFGYLERIKKHNLFIKRQVQTNTEGTVRLMTVHKSKGLEFAHVYIIRAVNGIFGGKMDRDRLPLIDSVYKLS